MPSAQDRLNQRVYHAARVPNYYRSDRLDNAETAALLAYQPQFAGRDVLDLGVGPGRTAFFLAPLARRYVCVDSSPPMIDRLRQRLPGIDARLADMRDLSWATPQSFDFVFASCNLIDAVSHEDRLVVLREVRRVLRPEGIFAFSSHNRRFRAALSGPRLVWARNPGTQALHVLRFARSVVNHVRVRRFRRIEPGYALLNDPGHDYAALHYYIDRDRQRQQLEDAGYRLLSIFDSNGRLVASEDDDRQETSLLYVASM
jgi:SAM-dependent methyltransferase